MNLPFDLVELAVMGACASLCLAIHFGRDIHLNRRAHRDLSQLHATHDHAASRLGGAAIFVSYLLTLFFLDGYFGRRHALVVATMMPMVAVTFWEDMAHPTPPRLRLAAVLVSSLLTVSLLGIWLPRIDLPALDSLMPGAVGAVITILFITAAVNGFNMIDGLNGLCSGTALAALVAMSGISESVGYGFMGDMTMVLAAAVAGFFVFNFPRGRIFLGDTGAYVLGYLIALFGTSICYRYPQVSPWAILLILGYPLGDLGISFLRRMIGGRSPFGADTLHLHHLVLAALRRYLTGERMRGWHNPLGTILVLPLAIAPMAYAAAYFDRSGMLQAGAAAYAIAMIGLYVALRAGMRGTPKGSPT